MWQTSSGFLQKKERKQRSRSSREDLKHNKKAPVVISYRGLVLFNKTIGPLKEINFDGITVWNYS
jgi:hypothetical protein